MHPGGSPTRSSGCTRRPTVQAALAHRDRTGKGQSSRFASSRPRQPRRGAGAGVVGATPGVAPEGGTATRSRTAGCYPCRTGERGPELLALSVVDDEQCRPSGPAVGPPRLGHRPGLARRPPVGGRARTSRRGPRRVGGERRVDEAVSALVAAGSPRRGSLTVPGCRRPSAPAPLHVSLDHAHGDAPLPGLAGAVSRASPDPAFGVAPRPWSAQRRGARRVA